MQIIKGKYSEAHVYNDEVEQSAISQIYSLNSHRTNLVNRKNYCEYEFENPDRLINGLMGHVKSCGYKISRKKDYDILKEIVTCIGETQNNKPFFYVGDISAWCWNSPQKRSDVSGWGYDYIRYEWMHLKSKNQNHIDVYNVIENFALGSARCNQHIQSGLDIEDVLKNPQYSDILKNRVKQVLESREKLFDSDKWKNILSRLHI